MHKTLIQGARLHAGCELLKGLSRQQIAPDAAFASSRNRRFPSPVTSQVSPLRVSQAPLAVDLQSAFKAPKPRRSPCNFPARPSPYYKRQPPPPPAALLPACGISCGEKLACSEERRKGRRLLLVLRERFPAPHICSAHRASACSHCASEQGCLPG